MLVKSKDDVINKLVLNKRETDGNVVVLQSEANKQKDEAKRLLNELNACIKQLKESEAEVRETIWRVALYKTRTFFNFPRRCTTKLPNTTPSLFW